MTVLQGYTLVADTTPSRVIALTDGLADKEVALAEERAVHPQPSHQWFSHNQEKQR